MDVMFGLKYPRKSLIILKLFFSSLINGNFKIRNSIIALFIWYKLIHRFIILLQINV